MIYPDFIKKGDTIATTAPSGGSEYEIDKIKLDLAKTNLEKLGYKIIETANCSKNKCGRSSSGQERAKELNSVIINKDVKAVICLSGGEFLVEMLSFVDFKSILENPKWIQGYSDPTCLLFPITTNLDIATIYGENFRSFAMEPMHKSLLNNLEILSGNNILQKSFDKYENERKEFITGKETYKLTKEVKWINFKDKEKINISGRIIGGCIDALLSLIGTKYDGTSRFIEKYKEDGIIWYFDNYELSSEGIIRAMWQLKELEYFKYCKGIVFGRNGIEKSYYDITLKEAVKQYLEELEIPIILETDIGHKPPRMTIINGAIAQIQSENGKGNIRFELR